MNALTLIVTSSRFLATSSARLNRNTCLSALAPYILSLSCSNIWPEIGLMVNSVEIVRPSFRMSVALVYALQKYFWPLDSNNILVVISENSAKFWRGCLQRKRQTQTGYRCEIFAISTSILTMKRTQTTWPNIRRLQTTTENYENYYRSFITLHCRYNYFYPCDE